MNEETTGKINTVRPEGYKKKDADSPVAQKQSMSMEEYRQSLMQMMQEEFQKAASVNSSHYKFNYPVTKITVDQKFNFDMSQMIAEYQFSLAGARLSNIPVNFPNGHRELGRFMGIVDTGVLLAKNKCKYGFSFFENGFSQKAFLESKDNVLWYTTLCKGILTSDATHTQSTFLLTWEEENMLYQINVPDNASHIIYPLRKYLLAQNDEARAVFRSCYVQFIAQAKNAVLNGDYAKAVSLLEKLFMYTDSNKENGYCRPVSLLLLIYLLQNNFNRAWAVTDTYSSCSAENYQWNPDEWKKILNEKETCYQEIQHHQHYHTALQSYQSGDFMNALRSIKQVIGKGKNCSVEAWQLYANLVLENANESNNFLIDDLNRLTSSGVSPEQKHVQEKETVRIKAVKNAYQDYQKQLKNQIVQKIREGNLKFIKTNQEIVSKFSDIYGMNALMYAALYQKKEIFDYLISLGIKVEQKNILDMNILNLSRLGSKNLDDYLNFVGKDWDLGYSKRYQAYQEKIAELKEEIQKQERNEKFLNATEKFSNGMSRIADRNGNAASSSSAELWANRASEEAYRAAEAKETAQYELDHAEENFRNEIQEYYQEVCTNAWNRLAGYTSAAKVNVSDVAFPPQPDFSGEQILPENTELEGYPPEYHELFATLQRNFISEYVSQHLPKLEPRGEFETTAQYKAREENHLAEKEKLAAEAEKQFQTEGLQRIREEYLFDIEARH
ncbi:MAG: hypothetical protein IKP69_00200, partial [Oscillospiraceae bacterium]|nr:hypothetical protein [Oscillospiraceae bacterium]